MKNHQTKTRQRVNVTLPSATLRLLDRVAAPGNRSRFIGEAVRFYIRQKGQSNLRQQLRQGAIARAERDLRLAEEWFPLENEIWTANKWR